jgi:hypothetical protein
LKKALFPELAPHDKFTGLEDEFAAVVYCGKHKKKTKLKTAS